MINNNCRSVEVDAVKISNPNSYNIKIFNKIDELQRWVFALVALLLWVLKDLNPDKYYIKLSFVAMALLYIFDFLSYLCNLYKAWRRSA